MPGKTILLCGLGRIGWRILDFLQHAGFNVVAIDNRCEETDPRLGNARLVRGDCRKAETLQLAGATDCDGVIVCTSDDLLNVSTTLMIRSLNPDVRIVVRVFNETLIGRLGNAIHNVFALSPSALTAPLLAVKALSGEALGTFRIDDLQESRRRQISSITIPGGSHLKGWTLRDIVNNYNVQLLAHVPINAPERFLMEVDLGAKLQVGDQIAVCGAPRQLRRLRRRGDEEGIQDIRWAHWLLRMFRTFFRAIAEIEWPVKLALMILICVVVSGTYVFYNYGGARDHSIPKALYHTVSIMATMADMRTNQDELKIFVSCLRFVGAALTAAFTAIMANYLLRASLRGALEVRRIPEGGHIVVSGLGAIGYRAVEDLKASGERVVAIEISSDNRFVSTLRRKGVPVILGDATLEEVLRQAHGENAKAVIACTSNDMVNLEVALLARQINEKQRVVLLQSEQHLANLIKEAANVRLAVSVPALAAPAFVAGLFGDRVQSVFLLNDRLLTVIDLVIQTEDRHLEGRSVRTVAIDYHLLPVAVIPGDGSPASRNPMHARLRQGDRLLAVISLPDLERLLRREKVPAPWAVDITSFPLAAREWLTLIVQRSQHLTTEEASKALTELPLCLEKDLTRGQADDLLALLKRERVEARRRPMPQDADQEVSNANR